MLHFQSRQMRWTQQRPSATCGGRRVAKVAVPGPHLLPHPRQRGVAGPRCEAGQQAGSATAEAAAPPAHQGRFEITLVGQEALATMKLGLVAEGRGQAVVVEEVAEGSRAEQLGVRRGHKLLALSDPMRYGTMWGLEDRPSLRFVVDTLRMRRREPVDLELQPLLNEAEMDAIFGSTAATGGEGEAASDPSASSSASASSSSSSSSSASLDRAAASGASIDLLTSSTEESGPTIGERLASKYADAQRGQAAVNQVQARIERRRARMEEDDARDDTGLIVGLAAAFLGPALIGLAVAYFTGYLDRLYFEALTLR